MSPRIARRHPHPSSFPRVVRTGAGPHLRLEPSWTAVLLRKTTRRRPNLGQHLRGLDLVQVSRRRGRARAAPDRHPAIINDTPRAVWVRHGQDRPIGREALTVLARRLGRPLRALAPVYRVPGTRGPGGLVCLLPDVLLLRPADSLGSAGARELDRRLAPLGLRCDERRSAALTGFRYYRVLAPGKTALELAAAVRRRAGRLATSVRFERMPLVKPLSFVPDDPFYGDQWGLRRIDTPGAWDLSLGHPSVVAAVIDGGCDLRHQDLRFTDDGIDLDETGGGDGSGLLDNAHGTACAGIIAARTDNGEGIAGIAGRSPILSVAVTSFTDAEIAMGIRYAADHGARVANISLAAYGPGDGLEPTGWDFEIIDPAIEYAVAKGLTICASTGNEDSETLNGYPARNPLVIACGGSSIDDNRKSPRSPDDECWGANHGDGMSVVAPCVQIPTTDRRGRTGFNVDGGEYKGAPCVSYGRAGDAAGNYFLYFNGTSAAAPHVTGVAALVVSANAYLDSRGVRFVIEKTADKVGTRAYAETPEHPVGPWTKQMGYGRVSARRAVELSGSLFVQHMNQLFGLG